MIPRTPYIEIGKGRTDSKGRFEVRARRPKDAKDYELFAIGFSVPRNIQGEKVESVGVTLLNPSPSTSNTILVPDDFRTQYRK